MSDTKKKIPKSSRRCASRLPKNYSLTCNFNSRDASASKKVLVKLSDTFHGPWSSQHQWERQGRAGPNEEKENWERHSLYILYEVDSNVLYNLIWSENWAGKSNHKFQILHKNGGVGEIGKLLNKRKQYSVEIKIDSKERTNKQYFCHEM